jgi:N-acetylglucosaminyldiphosphoundecaprenol N-acetyl-beta-D-mannosaminyltransferase
MLLMITKYDIFSLPFAVGSQSDLLDAVIALSEKKSASSVVFANAHVIVESEHSVGLKQRLQKSDLIVPDGVPVSWLLQAKGQKNAERYSGPDLMQDLFNKAPDARHFFLGSTEATIAKIKAKFKGNAVGFYSPPFTKDEFDGTEKRKQLQMIEAANPHFIWVGLGAPKQERYVVDMASQASRGVWLAVGAAFDFYAGVKPRAPKTVQKMGLEWAFRMASEPRRLTKRYLSTNPQFIRLAFKELIG